MCLGFDALPHVEYDMIMEQADASRVCICGTQTHLGGNCEREKVNMPHHSLPLARNDWILISHVSLDCKTLEL